MSEVKALKKHQVLKLQLEKDKQALIDLHVGQPPELNSVEYKFLATLDADRLIETMEKKGRLTETTFTLLFNLLLMTLGFPIITMKHRPQMVSDGTRTIEFEEDAFSNCWKVKKRKDGIEKKVYFKFCQKKNSYYIHNRDKELKNDPLMEISEFRELMMTEISKDMSVDFKQPYDTLKIHAQSWAEMRGYKEVKQIVMIQKLFIFLKDIIDVDRQTGTFDHGIDPNPGLDSKAGTLSEKLARS